MLAAHAAVAVCPRCDHRVRTGVELRAAAADLEELVLQLDPLRGSGDPADQELHDALACLIGRYTYELRAELAGEHLDCDAPGLDQGAVELALSRAAACAARERGLDH
jgi:hypothetical protein